MGRLTKEVIANWIQWLALAISVATLGLNIYQSGINEGTRQSEEIRSHQRSGR